MVAQRGSLPRKRAAPLRRAHTELARAERATAALSELWNAWSACFPPIPVEPQWLRDTKFVAELEKVTFDMKLFRPKASTPSMSYVMGSYSVSGIRLRPTREPAAWTVKQLIASDQSETL